MFVTFILGVIVGILVRDIKFKALEVYKKVDVHDWTHASNSTQFLEPISFKEKFTEAKSVDDLLE